ncbi:MAG: hypothetical protein IPF99_18780 [Deltaproteobacteria bacterium]|nr:hypothetical protein [Deltaproteobacteria bacterium]
MVAAQEATAREPEPLREAWPRWATASALAAPPSPEAAAVGSIGLSGSTSSSISIAGPGGASEGAGDVTTAGARQGIRCARA